jgi:hypothetical protein
MLAALDSGTGESMGDTAETKKNFAREQYAFLRARLQDSVQISRIFKIAGPGQVREAWALATSEDWTTDEGKTRLDLLDCILTGAGGMQDFSWPRMQKVLEYNHFYVPTSTCYRAFVRILDGALEILFPGTVPLPEEEDDS